MNFNKYKTISKALDVTIARYNFKKFLKKLILPKKKSLGRSFGTIVSWHRGGGVKRQYNLLYSNNILNLKGKDFGILRSINYDPNRSGFIGVVQFEDGSFCNILVSSTMKVNDIISFKNDKILELKKGDLLKLQYAPIGVPLFNLEKYPGSGAVYSRAAGVSSYLLTKGLNYGKIKLPSGEQKLFDLNCTVTLGVPSNVYNKFHKKYKAGTNRLLNRRPIVRGVAMNPIDHPHGGGAGKTAPGRPSVSPWGKLTKGVPTRKKFIKNKFIIKKR